MTEFKPPPYERAEPLYRDATCRGCGSRLMLHDHFYPTNGPIWYDEWVCVECQDGIRFDYPNGIPPNVLDGIEDIEEGDTVSTEEMREMLDLDDDGG